MRLGMDQYFVGVKPMPHAAHHCEAKPIAQPRSLATSCQRV
jgi:hypothetical protein